MSSSHDWAPAVDVEHLQAIRADTQWFGAGGVTHLVLEVVAYAVDEAVSGTTDQVRVVVHGDGSISVEDNGRGTRVRYDDAGKPTVKPIMATKDLRFFELPNAPMLADGHVRTGISVVAALSEWLVHTTFRDGRGWTQRYERGSPTGALVELAGVGRSGTTVRFRPDPEVFGSEAASASVIQSLCYSTSEVGVDVIDEGRHDRTPP